MRAYHMQYDAASFPESLFLAVPSGRAAASSDRTRLMPSAAAYSLLNFALLRDWGVCSPPEVIWEYGKKPVFAGGSGLHFSLSHSGAHVFCCIDRHQAGADIQLVRTVSPRTAARIMTPRELRAYSESGCSEDFFFRLWVLKEAYIKFYGGSVLDMPRISADLSAPRCGALSCGVYELPGCFAAVCSELGAIPECPETISLQDIVKNT